MIISKDNKKVKYARSLYNTKNRKKYQQFVVEGKKNVEMALDANCVDYVLTTNSFLNAEIVSEEVMKSIVSTVGVIDTIAVCNFPKFNSKFDRVLILDDISDPGNLGTLIRSALAFNFDAVICSNDTVDYTNPKVVRSSGGAVFHINVLYDDIVEFIKKSNNVTIGTFIDGNNQFESVAHFNLVIGNEGNGISKEVEELCDIKYRIEINEKLDSLNAGVAGSILMHQLGGTHDF